MLPLRDIVVFPGMVVPVFVGREKSVKALDALPKDDPKIFLTCQIDASDDDPKGEEIYPIGVIANVMQMLKLPDGTVKLVVEGESRAKITKYLKDDEYFDVEYETLSMESVDEVEEEALMRAIESELESYVKLSGSISEEAMSQVESADGADEYAEAVAWNMHVSAEKKQRVLAENNMSAKLELVYEFLRAELAVLRADKKIKSRVKTQMEKTQREYYLNEQMKAIQKELGDDEEAASEIDELKKKIETVALSKEAREKAEAELKKLKQMPPMSAEGTVVRNYLDWLTGLPWNKKTRVKKDLNAAEAILDADHYGLDKVKERILEFLAVQARSSELKGPILCLVGPPGVGKTSLGRSVAKATGREFIRIALGGVRDEAEIRGHRRTYIGSMPGKIIQSLKKAKSSNPLILLDEIDKMSNDFRGDPASAMLEVLDPEQNSTFMDHYLEVEYDLSKVLFLTTSNSYNIPGPLLDRMEIIPLSGYTEEEKLEIAKRHLLTKVIKAHGLRKGEFEVTEDALKDVVRYYTREAGVRSLERELAKLARKAVTKIVKKDADSIKVTVDNLSDFLGVRKHKFGLAELEDSVGVVTGLAYTSVGGDLLSIEALRLPGKGRMQTTGKLGDVMKESISAASSYVRSIAPSIGIEPPSIEKYDIHVHVPEGATPKDGPSAGLAMVTSIVSVMTKIPVRRDIAMTGEVTLRGHALPIGGLKEKLLAALRGGITTVFIPKDNVKDLKDMPESVLNGLEIIPVSHVQEVLKQALVRQPDPIEWDEVAYMAKKESENNSASIAH